MNAIGRRWAPSKARGRLEDDDADAARDHAAACHRGACGGVCLTCPECGLAPSYGVGVAPERFDHGSDECPVAAVIELAIEAYRLGGEELRG